MKIYTKTGDKGSTSLFGGTRLSKGNIRIEAYGTVDELNSHIGLVRDQEVNLKRVEFIASIQENLFVIGSNLAADPGNAKVKVPSLEKEAVAKLEAAMDEMDKELPPMRNFILPGGHQSISFCHIARCVCRRAERVVVLLNEQEPVKEELIVYLNRLSDYLFVLARKMTVELQAKEIPWKTST